MPEVSKLTNVNVRTVPCMGDENTLTGDDKWSHVKVQITKFTAIEIDYVQGDPVEQPVKVDNPGSIISDARIKLSGSGAGDLKVEPADRMGARIAQVIFEKSVTSFPVQAVLSGTYKSPKDGKERPMEAMFTIKDPLAKAAASCCVIT